MTSKPPSVREYLISTGEIADLLNITRQRIDQLSREPAFPKPIGIVGRTRIWRRQEIEYWIATKR